MTGFLRSLRCWPYPKPSCKPELRFKFSLPDPVFCPRTMPRFFVWEQVSGWDTMKIMKDMK